MEYQEQLKLNGGQTVSQNVHESIEREDITLSNPMLHKMTQYFQPYAPYGYLKQIYCESLHKGQYTLDEHD